LWVDLEPDIAQHAPRGLRGGPLIVQQEKLLRLAVSDYIDRIVAGRGLRQHVITQPRPMDEFAEHVLRPTGFIVAALFGVFSILAMP